MSRRDKLLVFGPQNLTDLYFDVYLRGIIFKAIRSALKPVPSLTSHSVSLKEAIEAHSTHPTPAFISPHEEREKKS